MVSEPIHRPFLLLQAIAVLFPHLAPRFIGSVVLLQNDIANLVCITCSHG